MLADGGGIGRLHNMLPTERHSKASPTHSTIVANTQTERQTPQNTYNRQTEAAKNEKERNTNRQEKGNGAWPHHNINRESRQTTDSMTRRIRWSVWELCGNFALLRHFLPVLPVVCESRSQAIGGENCQLPELPITSCYA